MPGSRRIISVVPEPLVSVRESSSFPANHRVLGLTGAPNMRDLGGYVALDGTRVKWRLLFRSDELTVLSEADVSLVKALGLNRVIDLRHQLEIERSGHDVIYPGNEAKYDFLGYVFGDPYGSRSNPGDNTKWDIRKIDFDSLYVNILECNREGWRRAFERLADSSQYPMLVHCSQGKDRTGVFAALVLLLLGVPERIVLEDYLLTDGLVDTAKGLRSMEAYLDAFRDLLPEDLTLDDWRPFLTCLPAAMENLLAYLDAEYGGAGGFVESIGITREQRSTIRDILLSK